MQTRPFRKMFSNAMVLCFALLPALVRAQEAHPPHWAYEGKEGPKD